MQHPLKNKAKKALSPRLLIALLAAVALLALAAVLLLPRLAPGPVGQIYPDPEPILPFETLSVSAPEQLDSLTITQRDGESYTLRYQSGALFLEQDGQLVDINDSLSNQLLEAATTIAVENVVTRDVAEVQDHLADMGLEPPRTNVLVRYQDGTQHTLHIGSPAPHTTYSYYRWSGDNGVYMCDAGVAEIFAYSANRLLPVAQPQLISSLVDHLTLTQPDGSLEIALTTDASGQASGRLLTPVPYPISTDAAAALVTSLDSFRLGTLLGDAEASDYGFDQPLCVVDIHQQEGLFTRINDEGQLVVETAPAQSLRFVFGRAEGEYFYTCAYEGQAYLVSRFLVESLIAATSTGLMTNHPADLGGWPAAIHVETSQGTLDVTLQQALRLQESGQPETDEDGNWIYDTSATVNGQPAAAEQVEALLSRLASLSFSGTLPEGWTPGEAAPRWRMTLTAQDGTQRSLVAYRLDAFSDAIAVDGVLLHYCYMEALATALGEWMP